MSDRISSELRDILGEEDYQELQLKSLVARADKGEFMPSLHSWLKTVNPKLNWDWRYIKFLIDHLQKLSDGEIRKLMISLPPRSGKTELSSIHFPAYFLEKNPENRVIIGTYNQTLANKLSRRVRALCKTRMELNPDRKAMEEWETKAGGGVRAVGVGAGIAGIGANLIVLDDVVRSRKDASSVTVRNSTYAWYTDDIYTRMEPDSRILLLATRWHEDDLLGRVASGEDKDDWVIINIPAIAESDDPLGREPGEALNPERYPIEKLLEIKRVMGRTFSALYQGHPTEQEGEFFKASWFVNNYVEALTSRYAKQEKPRFEFVRYWDMASSVDGDWTVGALLAKDRKAKEYYIVDIVRGRWSSHQRDNIMLETAIRDQTVFQQYGNVRVRFEIQPGSAGKDMAKYMTKKLAGFAVKGLRVTGDKEFRAEALADQCEAGNVFVVKSDVWNSTWLDEFCTFPLGKHDDIVDACSGAFNELSKGSSFISFGGNFLNNLTKED